MNRGTHLAPLRFLPFLCLSAALALKLFQQFPLLPSDLFRDRHLNRHVVVAANLIGSAKNMTVNGKEYWIE